MKNIAQVISNLPDNRINVIDIGCHTGKVTKDFVSLLPRDKYVFSIGIDPIHHAPVYQFTHYVQAAIRNCASMEAPFYQYSDPMCSSLLRMTENITHKYEERDTKWFGAHDFERLLNIRTVPVMPLSEVIEKYDLTNETIHFLKVDVQGLDLEVILSLGKYIKNCLFIQMETVTSHRSDMILYEGQMIYEQERPIIESHGFEVFSMHDYAEDGASPEADVIYRNKALDFVGESKSVG